MKSQQDLDKKEEKKLLRRRKKIIAIATIITLTLAIIATVCFYEFYLVPLEVNELEQTYTDIYSRDILVAYGLIYACQNISYLTIQQIEQRYLELVAEEERKQNEN